MTTRVTVLGTDAQTPGVWTGPQSMVQPSPLLGDDGGAGMLADATSQAIPNTLALRDADASFAVRALGLAAGAAFPAPDSSFAQIYYDQATRLFTFGTVAANFIVSGSAASEGASRLDIGGDSAVADELSIWASAADLDGPRLAMAYAGGTASVYSNTFGLNDITGSNFVGISVPAANVVRLSGAGANVTIQTAGDQDLIIGPAQAAAGVGQDIDIRVGQGATPGTNAPGQLNINLGSPVAGVGGKLSLRTGSGAGTEWGYFQQAAASIFDFAVLGVADTFRIRANSLGITSSSTIVSNGATGWTLQTNGTNQIQGNATGLGFFAGAPVAKPTVTGAKGGNAALTSLLAALANLGLITDSTT